MLNMNKYKINKNDLLTLLAVEFDTQQKAAEALEFKSRVSLHLLHGPILTDSETANIVRRMKVAGIAIPDSWKV